MDLSKIVVIDVEATCWENRAEQLSKGQEIIEVGICMLDVKMATIEAAQSLLVRPKRLEISPFCQQLTGISAEKIERDGRPLQEVCEQLGNEYCLADRVWASFGDFDRNLFERECAAKHITYPFSVQHLNIRILASLSLKCSRRVASIPAALKAFGSTFEGREHSGRDDAMNAARVLACVMWGSRRTETIHQRSR